MMKRIAVLLCLTILTSFCVAQEADVPRIGKLGLKLGQMATVEGTVIEGPFKGYEGGPNLIVKVINGKATQHKIQSIQSENDAMKARKRWR